MLDERSPCVHVRPATAEDAPAVAAIWWLGWRAGHPVRVPDEPAAAPTEESFRRRAAERVGDTTVAVVGGEVAGFVMVAGDEVEPVCVSPSQRGAGAAAALVAARRDVKDAASTPTSRS